MNLEPNFNPSPSTSRRGFLKAAGAAALFSSAGSAAPAFLRASDKAGARNPIIGKGDHLYECIHGWGQVPDHIRWHNTHGVTLDEQGYIYVKHQGAGNEPMDTIAVFDPEGKFVRSFGKEYHGGGHGLDLRKEGGQEFLYLCDIKNCWVVKTDLKGNVVWKFGTPKEPGVYNDKAVFRPTNVAFAPDGGFYVGDGYGSSYLHQYDKEARWIRTWGGDGAEPGKMKTPHGLWLDNRPGRDATLVVADRANARLQYFTLDGKHCCFNHDVLFPAHFDIRGDVLLVPDLHARVSLFNKDNKPIVHLGDDPEWIAEVKKFKVRADPKLWQPGKFIHPHDACFDKAGNIYVVEWVDAGRVTLLRHLI